MVLATHEKTSSAPGDFHEVCPYHVELHSGSQVPSSRQCTRDPRNPHHSLLRSSPQWVVPARMTNSSPTCTSFYVVFPCWHFLFAAPYGEAVGKLEVMVSRTVVALAPALGTPSGFPCTGGQYKPWYGSFSVLGKITALDRETDGKGEQTVITVFGSHSRVFPPLSEIEMSLNFGNISQSKWEQCPEQSYWETPEKWSPHGKPRRKNLLLRQDCLPVLCCHPGHISLITSFLADFSEQEAIYLSSWRQRRPSGKDRWMERRRFIVQSNEAFTWNISITQSRPYKRSC